MKNTIALPVPNKFTQEIKDKWLKALQSGEYKQGFNCLYNYAYDHNSDKDISCHCCIGVLGEIVQGLDNNSIEGIPDANGISPYDFLKDTIGYDNMHDIYYTNDNINAPVARDYSNVIPIIKSLPLQE
jgi:hypothetical protein